MSNVIAKDALAKIAISKNLIKEYKSSESDRTVYLNDGTEFQIYLKNPFQNHLGIKIYVNNKSIGNMLVLRPGQSFWLDRFVNENSKFLFSTYQVEDTNEMRYATSQNGKVKIEFFHEREQVHFEPCVFTYSGGSGNDWLNGYGNSISSSGVKRYNDIDTHTCYYNSTVTTGDAGDKSYHLTASSAISLDSAASTITASSATRSLSKKSIDKQANKAVDHNLSLETGRVEKGGRSNQEFETCDIDFEYYPFQTENILILPNSRKQVRTEDVRRKYCSQCGKKVSPKDKFCSNCGAKLD